jgi:hypothetical protein
MLSQHIARITRWTREPVTRPRWSYALGLLASVAIIAVGVAGYALTRPARTDASAWAGYPIAVCLVSVPGYVPGCAPARQVGPMVLSAGEVCRRMARGSLVEFYPPVSMPFHCVKGRPVRG